MGLGVAFSAVSTGSVQSILERLFWYSRGRLVLGAVRPLPSWLPRRALRMQRLQDAAPMGMTWSAHRAAGVLLQLQRCFMSRHVG